MSGSRQYRSQAQHLSGISDFEDKSSSSLGGAGELDLSRADNEHAAGGGAFPVDGYSFFKKELFPNSSEFQQRFLVQIAKSSGRTQLASEAFVCAASGGMQRHCASVEPAFPSIRRYQERKSRFVLIYQTIGTPGMDQPFTLIGPWPIQSCLGISCLVGTFVTAVTDKRLLDEMNSSIQAAFDMILIRTSRRIT